MPSLIFMPMDLLSAQTRLADALRERGFAEERAEALSKLLRECLRFETVPTADAEIAIGTTKFGGYPDLPHDFPWPEFKGLSLDFLGQLDLSEAPPLDASVTLPTSGLLSFFYSVASDAYGMGPRDFGAWAVVWSPKHGLSTLR